MQSTTPPEKIPLPFAENGMKNAIPIDPPVGATGAASLEEGFPQETFTLIELGGKPPQGKDMNGILHQLAAGTRWANAGAGYVYDAAFANDTHVLGYPMGSRLLRTDGKGYWLNTIEGNTNDPEGATPAGWVPDTTNGIADIAMTNANVTLTPLQYGKPIIRISGALTANLNLIFPAIAGKWIVINNCTGAFTINCKTLLGLGLEIRSGGDCRWMVSDGINVIPAQNVVEEALFAGFATNSVNTTNAINTTTAPKFDNSIKIANTAFVRGEGMFYSGVEYTAVGITLTSAQVGKLVIIAGNVGPITITMPNTAGLPSGSTLAFRNSSAYPVTLIRAGTALFNPGNATITSMQLLPGDTLGVAISGNTWECYAGSAMLPYSAMFKFDLGGEGYSTLPGGNILQWGVGLSTGAGKVNTFPYPFPTSCNMVVPVIVDSDGDINATVWSGWTRLSFTAAHNRGGLTLPINWLATGY